MAQTALDMARPNASIGWTTASKHGTKTASMAQTTTSMAHWTTNMTHATWSVARMILINESLHLLVDLSHQLMPKLLKLILYNWFCDPA